MREKRCVQVEDWPEFCRRINALSKCCFDLVYSYGNIFVIVPVHMKQKLAKRSMSAESDELSF